MFRPAFFPIRTLKKMVETTDQWILERTGIRERHIADKGVAASDLAVSAVKNLLQSHPFDLQEVDLIVVGTVTPDMMYPSTACLVQNKLGIANTWGFDVSAGCSGFLYSLNAGASFVESGQYRKVLVIGSDVNSIMTDYTDRAVCIIFGDGAGAVLLEPAEAGEDGIIDRVAQVEGAGGQYLYMPGGGSLNPASHETVDQKMHYIHQDGQQVFKYAVKKKSEMTERVLQKNGLTGKDVDCFIAHQANRRIIAATADRLKMPMEKVVINIDRFGNTTAGTIPLAMQTAVETGKLKKGNLVLLAAKWERDSLPGSHAAALGSPKIMHHATSPSPGHEVQQRTYGNHCFGCGPENETGLQLKFTLNEETNRFVCKFKLAPRFEGPPSHAHGGIIATILDEAMGKVSKLRNITAVTGQMAVTYLRPVPLNKPLITEGWEVSVRGREHNRVAEIRNPKGEVLAQESTGVFIEIDPHRMFAKFLKQKHSDAT